MQISKTKCSLTLIVAFLWLLQGCRKIDPSPYFLTSARIFDERGTAKVSFGASDIAKLPQELVLELNDLATQQDNHNKSLSPGTEEYPGMTGSYIVFLEFKATKSNTFVSVQFILDQDKKIVIAGNSTGIDRTRHVNEFLIDLLRSHPTTFPPPQPSKGSAPLDPREYDLPPP